jgi:hypothetical protein
MLPVSLIGLNAMVARSKSPAALAHPSLLSRSVASPIERIQRFCSRFSQTWQDNPVLLFIFSTVNRTTFLFPPTSRSLVYRAVNISFQLPSQLLSGLRTHFRQVNIGNNTISLINLSFNLLEVIPNSLCPPFVAIANTSTALH